jgi:hypothetical protein
MGKWLNWIHQKFKTKIKGASSIELIFFILVCSIMFLFSLEIYRVINDFHGKYKKIIAQQKTKIEKQLALLEQETEDKSV